MEPGSLLIITSLFYSYGSFLMLIWPVLCSGPGSQCEVCTRCITVYAKLSPRVPDTQLSGAGMILGSEQKHTWVKKSFYVALWPINPHEQLSAAQAVL